MQKLKNISKSKIYAALMGLIFVLVYSFFASHNSLWHDELETWRTVSQSTFIEFWKSYYQTQAHPPLYFLIQRAIGFFVEPSELSLRFFSIFCWGLGLAVVTAELARRQSMIFAVLFFVLSAVDSEIYNFAVEARPYGLFFLLFSLKFKGFLSSDDGTSKSNWFSTLIDILLLLTHYYSFFVVASFRLIDFFNKEKKTNSVELLRSSIILSLFFLVLVFKDFDHRFFYLENYYFQDLKFFISYLNNWPILVPFIVCGLLTFKLNQNSSDPSILIMKKSLQFLCYFNFTLVAISFFIGTWARAYTIFLKPIYIFLILSFIFQILKVLLSDSKGASKVVIHFTFVLSALMLGALNRIQSENASGFGLKTVATDYLKIADVINKLPEPSDEIGVVSIDSTPNAFLFYKNKIKSNRLKHLDLVSNQLEWGQIKERTEMALNSGLYKRYFVLINYSIPGNDLSNFLKFFGFRSTLLYANDHFALLQYFPLDDF